MELKRYTDMYDKETQQVLIEPLWNWNAVSTCMLGTLLLF